jgi:hypothetical protein
MGGRVVLTVSVQKTQLLTLGLGILRNGTLYQRSSAYTRSASAISSVPRKTQSRAS